MLKNIIFVSIILMTFSSCEKFFSTTIKVDPPVHVPQMAVHAFFNATDSTLYAGVAKTVGLLEDPGDLAKLNDATVEVYQGDQKICTMELREDPEYKFYNYSFELDKALDTYGETFEIRVSHKDFETATATQTIPKLVVPEKLRFIPNAGIIDGGGGQTSGVEIDFKDPAGEKNYYEVTVLYIDTFYNNNQLSMDYISSVDPIVKMGANYGTFIFNDNTFDGKDYQLNILLGSPERSADLVFVQWRSLSEAQYLYTSSIRAFQDAQDAGPFGEPVSIYSNMDKGLGVFGTASEDVYNVEE